MNNYIYKPKEQAFMAIVYFIYKKDGTPYTQQEIDRHENAKPFPSKYDSRQTVGGQWLHDDRMALAKLESMIAKWKNHIFSGYMVARTGEKIYTWQKDCILKVCGLVNWEYIKKSNGHTDVRYKSVTKVRDLSLQKQMPINYTTLDEITYQEKIKRKEELYAQMKNSKTTEPLTAGQKLKQLYGT